MDKKKFNSAKYNEAKSSFGVNKMSAILTKEARRAGFGHEMNMKLVKLEVRKIKLEAKKNLTENQKLQLEKIKNSIQIELNKIDDPKKKVVEKKVVEKKVVPKKVVSKKKEVKNEESEEEEEVPKKRIIKKTIEVEIELSDEE